MRTSRSGFTLVAALLLLAACSDDSPPAPTPVAGPTSPAVTVSPSPVVSASPTPPPFTAAEVGDFGKLCGTAEHRAEPSSLHSGAGPHAIVAFSRDAGQKEYSREYLVVRSGPEWDPQRPEDVALLACITGTKSGERVGTCRYQTDAGTAQVKVDGQRFTIDVFALRTGARVARKTFHADFCPPGLLTTNGGADIPRQMLSTMTVDDRAAVLDPFVKRPA